VTDFRVLLDIVEALGTPILAFLAWIVYRVKFNDLPHIQLRLDEVVERTSRIEGIHEGIALERTNPK
jgi:hypothetical protein